MPVARNTIKGAISAALNIGGAGCNPPEIISGWKGNGSFEIKDAVFSTLDFGKQLKEGVLDKLPAPIKKLVDGKLPDNLLDWKGQYQVVSTKFALGSGVMHINEIIGKSYPGKGLDMKGAGTVKLVDYGLDLSVDLIDVNNWLHLDDQLPDSRYHHFAVSPTIDGTLLAPHFNWAATITKLAQKRWQEAVRG